MLLLSLEFDCSVVARERLRREMKKVRAHLPTPELLKPLNPQTVHERQRQESSKKDQQLLAELK
jgi:hypothetical protein